LYIKYHEHPAYLSYVKAWHERDLKWRYILEGKDKKEWDDFLFVETELSHLPDFVIAGMKAPDRVYLNASFNSFGNLTLASLEPLSDEHFDILLRFAKVFDLTYTRFNDLKQAEAQAKEAKVEAALERVRSRAMAMHKTDELLDAAELIYRELSALGVTSMNISYAFVDENEKFGSYYSVNPVDGKTLPFPFIFPHTETDVMLSLLSSWKKQESFNVIELDEQATLKHQTYIGEHIQKQIAENNPEIPFTLDAFLAISPKKAVIYNFNFTQGYIFIIGNTHLTTEQEQMLLRFTKVFDLTFRRFLDLKQAEAQAREAQIELALERVRARTMAMHRSEELAETAQLLFHQLKDLGGIPDRISIGVVDEVDGVVNFWTTDQLGSHIDKSVKARLNERTVISKSYQAWKDNKRSMVIDLHGDDVKEWIKFVREEMGIAVKDEFIKDRRAQNLAFFSHGWILVTSHEPQSAETIQILERFASVFNLTYRRFLDLQKAEAQAREAQIEAALERVRSRTMAMQRSEELLEVINIFSDQLTKLDIYFDNVSFGVNDQADDFKFWLSSAGQPHPIQIQVPYYNNPAPNRVLEAQKKGLKFFADILTAEENKLWVQHLIAHSELKALPDNVKNYLLTSPGFARSTFILKNINLYIGNFKNKEYTEEENNIFKRFAQAFEQSYIRFLDLQKAEAQAREAHIEAALERVRARTMGMHQSKELHDVIETITNQLLALGLEFDNSVFCRINEDESWEMWMSTPQQSYPSIIHVPYLDHRVFNNLKEVKTKKIDFFTDVFDQDEARVFFKHFFANTIAENVPEERKQYVLSRSGFARSLFLTKDIWFVISRYAPDPFNDEENAILKRFAKVFEQSYTRFLDLQKAEAQAREAQIEAALERVRAASMAMHHSNELVKVATILYNQLISLGFDSVVSGGFNFPDDKNNIQKCWFADTGHEGYLKDFIIPLSGDAVLDQRIEYQQKNMPFLEQILIGEELRKHMEFVFPVNTASAAEGAARNAMPDPTVFTIRFLREGYLILVSNASLNEEQKAIVERFANAFNLAYTRFLDLQKAEAQAHEARIEISLERIRARALAMHKSDELMEVAKVLWEQMALLGQPELEASVVHLYEEDPDHIHSWRAVSIGTDSNTQLTYGHMAIPKNSCEVVREWLEKFYSDRKEYTIEIGGEKQKEWYDLLFKLAPDVINSMREKKDIHEKRYYRFSKFSGGALLMVSKQEPSVEVTYLQGRAAVVFDLAYRRFSDLQTAEAQAREAQIEAALERTRTQSMLMQHSNELDITSRVFHEQLLLLNIDSEFSYVWLPDVEKNKHLFWAAWSEEQNGSTILQSKSATYDLDKTEPYTAECFRAWESDEPVHIYPVASTEVKNFFDLWSEIMGDAKKLKPEFFPDGIYYDEAFMKYGCFGIVIRRLLTEDEKKILLRFTIEFERTYTRFLDLQKAEAQSREARIEAALEKVRASAMAMHNSDHVSEATGVLFSELDKLGIETMRCGIVIIHENQTMETWSATTTDDKKVIRISGLLDMTKHPLLIGGFKGWKNKEESYTYHLAGKDMENYYDFLAESPFYPIPKQRPDMPEHDCTIIYFNEGGLYTFSEKPHDDATIQVLKRFASVFSLTYRRYNDLKNAEAQAREAQIEAGLERVRAKAMAMHSSRDLAETLSVFYRELKSLSAIPIRCGVALMDKETRVAELTTMNTTGQGDSIEIIGKIKMAGHPVLDEVFENWLIQKEFHAILRGNQIKEYYQVLKPQISYLDYSHDEVQFGYYFMFKEGDVYAWTEKELTEGDLTIYRRFTTVISLTYKRYKDLQQAEAQAREAKIEAGLERVRARTMAMHSSDDVSTATATMFTELERLGIENFRGGITNILTNRTQHVWSVNNLAEGKIVKAVGAFNIDAHPFWQFMFGEWEAKKDFTYYFLAGQDKEEYIKILNKAQGYLPQAIQQFPDVHFQVYYFNEGAVWTNSLQPHSEEDQQVMKRFTSVFSLTFRRYQDLKKAEAQAREATIEAALERVRGKAMAMHSSEDLAATIVTFYHELELFSLTPRRCGVGLPDRETHIAELSTMNTTEIGNSIEVIGKLKMAGHPVLESIYENWLLQREYHPVLRGSEIGEYYQVMGSQITFPDYPNDIVQYGFFFYFPEGWVYAWTENEMQEDELKIYRRFTSVLSLTYKRYKDLQKAEANAREAVKQAALDRVRAEIASMRTINDLDRITPLIWNELTVLGIPFIRCGVFIMDEVQKIIHTFLSTPDGKAIAAFHLPYDTPGNFSDMLSHWYNKKTYISRWGEIDFIGIAETLVKQGAIANKEQYLVSLPKGGFYLHFLPFLQGMLYVGNTTQLKEEEIELIQHVADAFSTAYARYEDFNKLEAAKQQVEKTLTDLKQAQTQLVQSEKMASLGELTAGIAHEIQNPLNFVNNFSDVSNELLEEMKNELEKGNAEDAMAIVEDIKQNLEKILHHGKRADAIVKGMLQHSRTSSGQKEPTDINVLADEYLRLAFHGLRAKDKSFNAKFETDFDNSIGKISVIPQDIGRVILNLINNAFYAVTEKKKQNSNGYDPIVTVYTKKVNDKIEIKVKDNGNGIPQKVLDKIFQPFFTTKPTGQGTGLGLSLSYDIIKAHGGELKVETKEGDGAEFIIQIPMN
jgi:signal transduction histidine kinase